MKAETDELVLAAHLVAAAFDLRDEDALIVTLRRLSKAAKAHDLAEEAASRPDPDPVAAHREGGVL